METVFYLSFAVNCFFIAFLFYAVRATWSQLKNRRPHTAYGNPNEPAWNMQCASCGRWLLFKADKTIPECAELAKAGNWIMERRYGAEFAFCNECRMIKD